MPSKRKSEQKQEAEAVAPEDQTPAQEPVADSATAAPKPKSAEPDVAVSVLLASPPEGCSRLHIRAFVERHANDPRRPRSEWERMLRAQRTKREL